MNYVDNPFESPVVISFCPGILGLERGLARAGVECRVAAYVEIEAFIIANLVAGMEAGVLGPAPIWTDAKTFDARPFRGKVHGIIGGYPCQPFSTAGKQKGKKDERHLWPHIFSAIRTIKPLWLFFENVEAHLKNGYIEVRASLESIGYRVKEGIFSAEEVGAPQKRRRLFILAIMGHASGEYKFKDRNESGESKFSARGSGSFLGNPMHNEGAISQYKSRNSFEVRGASKTVAYPPGSRFSQFRDNGEPIEKENNRVGDTSTDLWPAGQGIFQYDWEKPRTIEPGLGCTIDGYNFREDLVRALGNSVVEQTAEIAFKNLLQKHLKS